MRGFVLRFEVAAVPTSRLQSRLRSGDRVKTLDWLLVTVTHFITSKRSRKLRQQN